METNQSPFSFLAIKTIRTKKPVSEGCGRAWIDNQFHLNGNNYFIYTCHSCQQKQVKKGKMPLNWGGKYV
ncbi:hypothetical protein [endosymbiont GvMRE of Glomus versiforme]|uniref:hypothetical protein n=1 Tax=endosymbiont GvMRE of Glomus versiforme TaxID=2039283 RepID=UPI000EDE070B|nr:hypothetical protein [endosymbiont GvMRE of Glomus versiforme]RHZ36737.1 Partition protein ParA [endosymbiont GvMRE of Glomus versiforme]RHZ37540.1 Partition protein ParA [endosymbiont GvMRE of Glomus versiforme]